MYTLYSHFIDALLLTCTECLCFLLNSILVCSVWLVFIFWVLKSHRMLLNYNNKKKQKIFYLIYCLKVIIFLYIFSNLHSCLISTIYLTSYLVFLNISFSIDIIKLRQNKFAFIEKKYYWKIMCDNFLLLYLSSSYKMTYYQIP